MILQWSPEAWNEYLEWQTGDKKTLKRINVLVKSIQRDAKQRIYSIYAKGQMAMHFPQVSFSVLLRISAK